MYGIGHLSHEFFPTVQPIVIILGLLLGWKCVRLSLYADLEFLRILLPNLKNKYLFWTNQHILKPPSGDTVALVASTYGKGATRRVRKATICLPTEVNVVSGKALVRIAPCITCLISQLIEHYQTFINLSLSHLADTASDVEP